MFYAKEILLILFGGGGQRQTAFVLRISENISAGTKITGMMTFLE